MGNFRKALWARINGKPVKGELGREAAYLLGIPHQENKK